MVYVQWLPVNPSADDNEDEKKGRHGAMAAFCMQVCVAVEWEPGVVGL